MTLADLEFLLSAEGQRHLANLASTPVTEQSHLGLATRLRKTLGSSETHALLETALLRERAGSKFSRADQMYFDRAGLEMSSAEIISIWRSNRYAQYTRIADLCCGIGGDALGLAAQGTVVAVDRDPVRLAMARANLAAYGRDNQLEVVEADLEDMDPFSAEAIFFDPARRTDNGKRIYSIYGYRPPLSILDRWRGTTSNWGIKISPGFDYAELPDEAHVEFISVGYELREAVLWYGDLKPAAQRTATLLPSGDVLDSNSADCQPEISDPKLWLYEPDPAILRARLVTNLAAHLNASQIDSSISYLTSNDMVQTPFARWFEVEDWFPFQLKRLRSYLRERNVGRIEIKKRGSAVEVDSLRRQLRLKGKENRTVFLTMLRGNPIVIVANQVII